mmetsp:Transcript_29948/g.96097  ORF Transcript_29948/g.96097 Transcript_29948/m.96097 type:complete len:333 (+) Transcript_29948:899-1897(+)
MDGVAMLVAEHLELDVARVAHEALHVARPVAEGSQGLPVGLLVQRNEVLGLLAQAHATAAAASSGLDHDRVADRIRDLLGLGLVLDEAVRAGHRGHARLVHGVTSSGLVAHDADGIGRGADELDPVIPADVNELRILGQEAIARVDGISTARDASSNHVGNVEVRLAGSSLAHADSLVRELHVEAVLVDEGVNGHGLEAELLARPDNANGDFTTVGNKDLLDRLHGLGAASAAAHDRLALSAGGKGRSGDEVSARHAAHEVAPLHRARGGARPSLGDSHIPAEAPRSDGGAAGDRLGRAGLGQCNGREGRRGVHGGGKSRSLPSLRRLSPPV